MRPNRSGVVVHLAELLRYHSLQAPSVQVASRIAVELPVTAAPSHPIKHGRFAELDFFLTGANVGDVIRMNELPEGRAPSLRVVEKPHGPATVAQGGVW